LLAAFELKRNKFLRNEGVNEDEAREAAKAYIAAVRLRCKEKKLRFPSKLNVSSLMRG